MLVMRVGNGFLCYALCEEGKDGFTTVRDLFLMLNFVGLVNKKGAQVNLMWKSSVFLR